MSPHYCDDDPVREESSDPLQKHSVLAYWLPSRAPIAAAEYYSVYWHHLADDPEDFRMLDVQPIAGAKRFPPCLLWVVPR